MDVSFGTHLNNNVIEVAYFACMPLHLVHYSVVVLNGILLYILLHYYFNVSDFYYFISVQYVLQGSKCGNLSLMYYVSFS